jgi:hypothetical protein
MATDRLRDIPVLMLLPSCKTVQFHSRGSADWTIWYSKPDRARLYRFPGIPTQVDVPSVSRAAELHGLAGTIFVETPSSATVAKPVGENFWFSGEEIPFTEGGAAGAVGAACPVAGGKAAPPGAVILPGGLLKGFPPKGFPPKGFPPKAPPVPGGVLVVAPLTVLPPGAPGAGPAAPVPGAAGKTAEKLAVPKLRAARP